MKLRHAIAATLFCTYGTNAMAYDWLNDWPTKYKTTDGYEFGFKGLYQYDLNQFSGDTTSPTTGAEILPDANAWRRKEFNFYGKTPWGFDFNIGYDFTVSGFKAASVGVHGTWIDNFLRYSNKDYGDFRVGQFKTPVGWEEANVSSSATTFLDRALPVQATNAGRRIGADWQYTSIPNWVFQAAYFSGGDLNGDNDGHGPAVRVAFAPFNHQPGQGSREVGNVLHLGFTAQSETRDATVDGRNATSKPSARFRARPEVNLGSTRLVDTTLPFCYGDQKTCDGDDITRFGIEAAYIHGPLLLQGEYLRVSTDYVTGKLSDHSAAKHSYTGDGYYVQGSWILTGESRPYTKGSIGNVRPIHEWGAFEVALRYSKVDLNDGIFAPTVAGGAPAPFGFGGEQDDWTIGANWYLGQHLKFQANYIWANSTKRYGAPINGDAAVDPRIFALRAQIYF